MALLFRDVVKALLHLHGNGILHLDLKCLNIMLGGRIQGQWHAPRAVVMDLGMALLMQPGLGFAWQNGWRYASLARLPHSLAFAIGIGQTEDYFWEAMLVLLAYRASISDGTSGPQQGSSVHFELCKICATSMGPDRKGSRNAVGFV